MNATSRQPLVAALIVAALGAGLAGCDRRDANAPDTAVGQAEPSNAPTTTERAQGAISDATITASVNAKLAGDNELSALRIDVDTVDGRVALKGTAPNPSARERAAQLAQAVEGVRSVDNQLTVSQG